MGLLLAASAAAAAAWLVLPIGPSSGSGRWQSRPTQPPTERGLRFGVPIVAVGSLAVTMLVLRPQPHHVLVGLTALGVVWSGSVLVRRGRLRNRRADQRREAVDVCDALVAELRSGQPPGHALAWVVRSWPGLERASTVAGLGGDVPGSLRQLAARPGAEPFGRIAAGWEVAQRRGAGLADVLDCLSRSLRDDEDVRREISASLRPTRATGRLLALLPVFGLGLGYTMGADPLAVLVGSTLGASCLALGAALAVGGLFWVERIADRAEP